MRRCKARPDSIRCNGLIPKEAAAHVQWCSPECGATIAMLRLAKHKASQERTRKREQKVKVARRKRAFYDTDIKTRKAAAIREFNAYIRERDKGLVCISCGKPIPEGDYCAGHYIPAGNNSLLRFDEVNVNGQHNNDCNKHRSGDQVRYRKGLLVKWGEAQVDRLESTNGIIKRTAADYKAIEIEYREKRHNLVIQDQGSIAA